MIKCYLLTAQKDTQTVLQSCTGHDNNEYRYIKQQYNQKPAILYSMPVTNSINFYCTTKNRTGPQLLKIVQQ